MEQACKVVFFGSSHHCLVTLEALIKNPAYRLVAVVTQPAKPVGRKQVITPTAVEVWALDHQIKVFKPLSWKREVSAKERARLAELGATVAVLSNYGKILPQSVIDIFPQGIVNIHPSLLPLHRGPAPAVGALLSGAAVSGTTIILLTAEMDAGPVLGSVEFAISADETQDSYYEKGFRLGTECLMALLPEYLIGRLVPTEQDHSQATYTKMLSRENGRIDWSKSAIEIAREVRAYDPWPGSWTDVFQGTDGLICFPEAMALRVGMPVLSTEVDADNLQQRRMKIHSGHLADGYFIPDLVQLEGETKRAFSSLKIQS